MRNIGLQRRRIPATSVAGLTAIHHAKRKRRLRKPLGFVQTAFSFLEKVWWLRQIRPNPTKRREPFNRE